MPNHVVNEVIFRGLDEDTCRLLLANLCDDEGRVDFERLLPAPLNIWCGNVGSKHSETFPDTHLDWATKNWGTKWNAYNHRPVERIGNTLILRFDTAWRPPYGWLVAIFNRFKISFEHNWLDEGAARGVCGVFNWAEREKLFGEPWSEKPADDDMQRHLHKLCWGVESFDDEAAE